MSTFHHVFFILCFSLISFNSHALNIAKSAKDTQPIKVGTQAPDFTVYDIYNKPYQFTPNKLSKPTLIITYRGGWCGYCNRQLSSLRHVLPELGKLGVKTLFLSGDSPQALHSSLQKSTQKLIEHLPYTIYSDADLKASSALGIAFKDERTSKFLKKRPTIKGSSLDKHQALPVPSVFFIDKKGVVRYVFSEPKYSVRLPHDQLLERVKQILSQ